MRNVLDISLENLKWIKIRNKRMSNILLILSFVVTISVFWGLRQPGLTLAGDATCGIVEHTHDDTCGEIICICDLPEEPHTHDENCYETNWIVEREEMQLICEETDETHLHTDDCYELVVTQYTERDFNGEGEAREVQMLVCELSEEAHIHDDTCYEWDLTCDLEEHVHSIACYSDSTADVETVLDWEEMFADYPYTGDLREDLVGVALTQVGYSESTLNFEVDDDGERHGYTRYGAWYGTPYKEWSAMFVSFCLNYAGADMDEVPGNSGARSMAKRWDRLGKYAEADEYDPVSGDLVFFDDNTVGIVAEKQETTVYVVRGDVDDAVETELFALASDEIIGWGSTVGTVPEIEKQPDFELQYEEYMLDTSNGPAFYIFAGDEVQQEGGLFSFRNSRSVADLLDYLEKNGGRYFFTLLDMNNHELPKDANGNYIAEAYTEYKLTITIVSPEGFAPGSYRYQIPNGMEIDGGEGDFVLKDDTNVGSWVVTNDGLITLQLNEHIDSRTDVTISATMKIRFPNEGKNIDFDGKITVVVKEPQQEIQSTTVEKWGVQGDPAIEGKSDPTKIYWTVRITGNGDSAIPGSILTDRTLEHDWSYKHQYTQSDKDGGLSFGASVVDPETGNELFWHRWKVSVGDPNLTWTADGWTYKMPETITCFVCGNEVQLGNEYWTYYVDYTSTPEMNNTAGGLPYANKVEIDNQSAEGWAEFTQTEVDADVHKTGKFISDASGGRYLWEVQVTIPGRESEERAVRDWFINDTMTVRGPGQETALIAYAANDIHQATVTANYHGKTINVPRIQDATADDPYAWMLHWSNDQGGNGFYDLRQIYILSRCECTEESCALNSCWNYGFVTDDGGWVADSGYCSCWTETEDTTFTFSYVTEDISTIGAYGGLGYSLQNEVFLAYPGSAVIADDYARVPIPSMLKKELTHEFDGHIASYKVTVNESKLELTNGSPLVIHDVMTETLAYISGSLVITAEDGNGNTTTLKQGVDYYVTYDGTGNQTDGGKKVHVLDIVIQHPQPVMYILEYDAILVMPEEITEGIKYNNSATITLWGKKITDITQETVYPDINIAAKRYKVDVIKTCVETGKPLGGATFALYNEKGGLITTETSNAEGHLFFQTSVTEGIILQEHEAYYIQEIRAPEGYRLDDTEHWFCFCSTAEASCTTCDEVLAGKGDAKRIPFEQIGDFSITNEVMRYQLPVTGGPGIYPLILVSVMLIFTPLVYIQKSKQRRKRERRRARRYSRASTKMRQR